MTRRLKNRLRAMFLLMVFSLNTVAGFACSVGLDMGYNKHHHEHGKTHSHKHGMGNHMHRHQHNKQNATLAVKEAPSSDDCCSNAVAKFTLLDKAVADNSLPLHVPVFLLSLTTTFLLQAHEVPALAVNSRFQFVRRRPFLNDTDLRIAIQSFQI